MLSLIKEEIINVKALLLREDLNGLEKHSLSSYLTDRLKEANRRNLWQ